MRVTSTEKQTEVRAIPEDWHCTRISGAAAPTANAIVGGPFGSDLVSSDYEASGTPVIRGKNMSEGVVCGEFVFVSPRKAKSLTANLARPHDLVFTQRGTLGQVALVPDGAFENYVISQSQMKVTLDRSRHDPAFVRQYFASGEGQKQILNSAIQTGVPHTNLGILREYHFPAPSLREQRAIAEVLSDTDELLGALDALIAKKRAMKQGAMQQLLSGNVRIPGFDKEWRDASIGELISRFATGLNPRQNFRLNSGGALFYVTIKNFFQGRLDLSDECDGIDEEAFRLINARADLRKGDILFASIGRVGDAYLITTTPTNWNINESVFTLRPDTRQVVPLMLFHLLTSKAVKDSLDQGATGSTFTSIKQADLKRIKCRLPTSLEEQTAIATALSDMDAEIAALESRRDKTRAIKQGMMQQLLTGRVRLVKSEPAEANA